MGLMAAAKSLSGKSYDSMEDMARDCIQLADLLAADADRVAAPYREAGQPVTGKVEAGGHVPAIEKFIRDNELERSRFVSWLANIFPEMREEGLGGITPDHAKRVLGNPAGCLEKYRAWMEGGPEKLTA